MTFQEVASMIESIGLPFVYDSFPNNEAPQAPYIVFNYPNNDDFGADNTNYVSIDTLNIELYESTKDFALEQTIEAVLNELLDNRGGFVDSDSKAKSLKFGAYVL